MFTNNGEIDVQMNCTQEKRENASGAWTPWGGRPHGVKILTFGNNKITKISHLMIMGTNCCHGNRFLFSSWNLQWRSGFWLWLMILKCYYRRPSHRGSNGVCSLRGRGVRIWSSGPQGSSGYKASKSVSWVLQGQNGLEVTISFGVFVLFSNMTATPYYPGPHNYH